MMLPLTIAAIGAMATATYFSPFALRMIRVHSLRKQLSKKRAVILTYDDGPSGKVTPRLLDLLHSHNAKAAFFMLGRNAEKWPEVADRIVQGGHDVGCHSYQHLNAWTVAPWKAMDDINSGYDVLSTWVRSDGMFRPPFGKMTLPTFWTVRNRGASVAWWTIDSGDTRANLPQPSQVADRLANQGGGIILMHDIERSKERDEFVLKTTDVVLRTARRERLNIMTLTGLCG